MIKINCCVCGKEIINPRMSQVTCSKQCRLKYPQSPLGLLYRKENKEKIKIARKKYSKTEAFKKSQARYRSSEKFKEWKQKQKQKKKVQNV